MIYGYASTPVSGTVSGLSLEEQIQLIKQRYPSSDIVTEKYENPKDRPLLKECLSNMYGGDTLVVCKLDRFCGSIKESIALVELALSRNVRINLIDVGMIDNSHTGRVILNLLRAIAEFDKNMIVERTSWGKEIAKSKEGFKEGRPKKFSEKQIDDALEMLKDKSYKEVEESTGISKSTLIRAKKSQLSDIQ